MGGENIEIRSESAGAVNPQVPTEKKQGVKSLPKEMQPTAKAAEQAASEVLRKSITEQKETLTARVAHLTNKKVKALLQESIENPKNKTMHTLGAIGEVIQKERKKWFGKNASLIKELKGIGEGFFEVAKLEGELDR